MKAVKSQESRVERQKKVEAGESSVESRREAGELVELREAFADVSHAGGVDTSVDYEAVDIDALYTEMQEPVEFHFAIDRRSFVQMLGAGVMITVVGALALGQQRQQRGRGGGRRGGGGFFGGPPVALSARIHLGEDGTITVLSGKVDCGQGARGELAQVAAEELRVPVSSVRMVLADTSLVPNDGITAGSGTTPRTVPAVRQAAAAVRRLLVDYASAKWGVEPDEVTIGEGRLQRKGSKESISFADLTKDDEFAKKFGGQPPANSPVTPTADWSTMGKPQAAPSARDKVTGKHQYPSDMTLPGMLYGKVLRAPTYLGSLKAADLGPSQQLTGVVAVRDGGFVGVAAPTSFQAGKAIEAIAKTAEWDNPPHPSSDELYDYLRKNARVPENPFADAVAASPKSLKQTYTVAYVQHAPLEPRVALANWEGNKLSVWTGTQNPFGVQGELQRAFGSAVGEVRVIVPDFGSGYGGKHTGEAAVEAARIAKAAGKPVMLRWTREEEFTWAAFRPAGVIDCAASLDSQNRLTSWWHLNINSGNASMECPYAIANKRSQTVNVPQPPLRHSSYRGLAATANTFARESFMDELAALAEADPLEFRLAHLEDPRLKPVLEEAARSFRWKDRVKNRKPNTGVGLSCSIDKGSYVAACVEASVDPDTKEIKVLHICEAFECGAIVNPDNLRNQVEGAITMSIGPALSEEMKFKDGVIENASFRQYRVPHFKDVPTMDIRLVNRPDLPSAGAGETPIIALAPAVANAVFQITGQRIRSMPMKLA